jgi:hypothetical protein
MPVVKNSGSTTRRDPAFAASAMSVAQARRFASALPSRAWV